MLSKEYTIDIEYGIVYQKAPNNLIIVNKPSSTLIFSVEGTGWDLLRHRYFSGKSEINIDLSNLKLKKENGHYTSTISTSGYREEFLQKLGAGNALREIVPQTIFLQFESVASKKVPVIADLQLTFKNQFFLYDRVRIIPDHIIVSGRQDKVDSVDKVTTQKLVLNDIDADSKNTIQIVGLESDDLKFSPEEVIIELNVEEYAEDVIELYVRVISNDNLSFRTFPEKVKVLYHVPLKEYARVDSEGFEATAEYISGVSGENGRWLNVNVSRKPSFVKVIRITPERVEYLMLEND